MKNTGTATNDPVELANRRAAAYLGRLRQARRTGKDEPAAERAYATAMRELGEAWDTRFPQLTGQS